MNRISKYNYRAKGFTLVETMIAVSIFGIAMLVAFVLMSSTLRSIRANREQAYVARLAESTLETVRHLSWSELTAQPEVQTFDATKPLTPLFDKAINPLTTTDPEFGGTVFGPTGKIHIEPVAAQPDLRRVTIVILHTSSSTGNETRQSLVTLISKNGIDRR